jgi:hypothetical protein
MIEDRDEFRRRYESGEPVKVLAYDYGVCISAVSQMARRMGIIRRKRSGSGGGASCHVYLPTAIIARIEELATTQQVARSTVVAELLAKAMA